MNEQYLIAVGILSKFGILVASLLDIDNLLSSFFNFGIWSFLLFAFRLILKMCR